MRLTLQAFEGRDLPDAVPVLPVPVLNPVEVLDSQTLSLPANQFALSLDPSVGSLVIGGTQFVRTLATDGSGTESWTDGSETTPIPPVQPRVIPLPGALAPPAAPQPQPGVAVPGRVILVS